MLRKAPALMAALGLAFATAVSPAPAQADTSPFYVDPDSHPAAWARDNASDPSAARIRDAIGSRPIATWFGNWNADVTADVSAYTAKAQQAGKIPVLVAYNITDRDCSGHSQGGAGSFELYQKWIREFAAGIGTRQAVVVVEPDAVAQLDCLPADPPGDSPQTKRLQLLNYAVDQLRSQAPNAKVYLDGGNAHWIGAETMAERLHRAGLSRARGFSVNVSNFFTTAESVTYAGNVNKTLSARYGYTRTFVVDTARNGAGGTPGDWCNPPSARLGTPPREGGDGAEALLWIKVPGDSDGPCDPDKTPAGTFNPKLAMGLIGDQ